MPYKRYRSSFLSNFKTGLKHEDLANDQPKERRTDPGSKGQPANRTSFASRLDFEQFGSALAERLRTPIPRRPAKLKIKFAVKQPAFAVHNRDPDAECAKVHSRDNRQVVIILLQKSWANERTRLERLRKNLSSSLERTPAAKQCAEKIALQSEEQPQRLKPD